MRSRSVVIFDYSISEWQDIDAAVRAVREVPISEEERVSLCQAADEYRHNNAKRKNGRYVSPKQGAQSYAKVARLCGQLRDALQEAAKNRHDDAWRSRPAAIIQHELRERLIFALLGRWRIPASFPDISDASSLLSYGDVVDVLTVLQAEWERDADPFYWGVALKYSFSGRREPSVVYYQRILLLWKDTFGGRLAISRNGQQSRKIGGPLVRYFFAVTRPVMGDETPSLQSLPDIVDRQKDFDHWWIAYKRLMDKTGPDQEEERFAEYIRQIERRHPSIASWAKKLHSAT